MFEVGQWTLAFDSCSRATQPQHEAFCVPLVRIWEYAIIFDLRRNKLRQWIQRIQSDTLSALEYHIHIIHVIHYLNIG